MIILWMFYMPRKCKRNSHTVLICLKSGLIETTKLDGHENAKNYSRILGGERNSI